MPFVSKSQARKCFAMKARGQAKGWDCEEWAEETDFDELPEKKKDKEGKKAAARLLASYLRYCQARQKSVKEAQARRLVKQAFIRALFPTGARLARSIVRNPSLPLWYTVAFNPLTTYAAGTLGGRALGHAMGWDPELSSSIGGTVGLLGGSLFNPIFNPMYSRSLHQAARSLGGRGQRLMQRAQQMMQTDKEKAQQMLQLAKLYQSMPGTLGGAAAMAPTTLGASIMGATMLNTLPEDWQGYAAPVFLGALPMLAGWGALRHFNAAILPRYEQYIKALRTANRVPVQRAVQQARAAQAGQQAAAAQLAEQAAAAQVAQQARAMQAAASPLAQFTAPAGSAWHPAEAARRLGEFSMSGPGFMTTLIGIPVLGQLAEAKGKMHAIAKQDQMLRDMGFQGGIREVASLLPQLAPVLQQFNQLPPQMRYQLMAQLPQIAPLLQQFASLPPQQQQALLNQIVNMTSGGAGGGWLGWLGRLFGM